MKYSAKTNFNGMNEWEYESEKKRERKQTKETRTIRRNKRNIWTSSDS